MCDILSSRKFIASITRQSKIMFKVNNRNTRTRCEICSNLTIKMHVKNLEILKTEMFKISKSFSVPLMSELFHQKVNHYDLRKPCEFSIPNVNNVFHGQGSISYLGPLIWQLLPYEFKDLNTVSAFKTAIKNWKPNNCPCRLCKTYIGNVGWNARVFAWFLYLNF